jgi:formylglycine-generating enzyme required for sulfatase activity
MGAKAMTETLHTVALKMVDTLDAMGFLPEFTGTLRRAIREPMESPVDEMESPEVEEDSSLGEKLLRGGSWLIRARKCRSAYRGNIHRISRNDSIGFRVVCLF